MAKKRVFTSFDFDHDEELRNALVAQSRNPGSPFAMADWSVKGPIAESWKKKVRSRIQNADLVIVICGEHTHDARGVTAELTMAREEGKPYFLLRGRSSRTCTRPKSATTTDKMYKWTWDNLKSLIGGAR